MMTYQEVRERILRAWVDRYLDLRDQLAAERELVKYWQGAYAALHKELIEERRLHDERIGFQISPTCDATFTQTPPPGHRLRK